MPECVSYLLIIIVEFLKDREEGGFVVERIIIHFTQVDTWRVGNHKREIAFDKLRLRSKGFSILSLAPFP